MSLTNVPDINVGKIRGERMAKMKAATFVANARKYLGQPYSKIDCAKLPSLASNGAIKATGSNYQWRYETGEKGRITDGKPGDPYPAGNDRKSSQLEVGMAVFMHKKADTKKYPDGLGDYCHVGIVSSVKPLRIINASSVEGKVTEYTRIGTFCAWAYFKDIDYGISTEPAEAVGETTTQGGTTMLYQAKVVTGSAPLNVRANPSTKAARKGSVKKGAIVNVYETQSGWSRISYGALEGWASSQYLQKVKGTQQAASEAGAADMTIEEYEASIQRGEGVSYEGTAPLDE